jgi:prevent-host-death family protein
MPRRFSIAEPRHDLAAIVQELESRDHIELTRRGEPVAIMLSLREYRRLAAGREKFWDAYRRYRETADLSRLGTEPEIFEEIRDPSPGREARL